jgi:hypothetical protein
MSNPNISYLNHRQYVAMVFSRFLRDSDSLKYLMKVWLDIYPEWTIQWYENRRKYLTDFVDIRRVYRSHFDIGHFYPRFLAVYDPINRSYKDMGIREKLALIKRLNADEDTYSMRRKSLYLFKRNNVDEQNYPSDTMVLPYSSQYLVGVMGYTIHT